MTFEGKVILIVGASSGMGRVLAKRLAGEGATLAVTARRKDKLESLAAEIAAAGGRCLPLVADATDEAAATAVVDAVVEHFGRLDMIYLNAGGAPALDMRIMTAGQVSTYMRTNYDVVVNYLFPALRQMVIQGGGHVGHTNSLAGLLGVPLQGPYCAAKAATILLIDTCRMEFRRAGIRFTTVYPGFVATEITAGDGMPAPLEISTDKAVDHILYALRHKKRDYLFPFSMRWIIRISRILPKSLVLWILEKTLPDSPTPPSTAAVDGAVATS